MKDHKSSIVQVPTHKTMLGTIAAVTLWTGQVMAQTLNPQNLFDLLKKEKWGRIDAESFRETVKAMLRENQSVAALQNEKAETLLDGLLNRCRLTGCGEPEVPPIQDDEFWNFPFSPRREKVMQEFYSSNVISCVGEAFKAQNSSIEGKDLGGNEDFSNILVRAKNGEVIVGCNDAPILLPPPSVSVLWEIYDAIQNWRGMIGGIVCILLIFIAGYMLKRYGCCSKPQEMFDLDLEAAASSESNLITYSKPKPVEDSSLQTTQETSFSSKQSEERDLAHLTSPRLGV